MSFFFFFFKTAAFPLFKDKDLIIQDKLLLSLAPLSSTGVWKGGKDIIDETICCGYESSGGKLHAGRVKMSVFTRGL